MTAPHTGSSADSADRRSSAWTQLIVRLHFYIGLFIGPFIFVAALSGTLFVLTPQIENMIYAQALRTESTGAPRALSEQVQTAMDRMGVQTLPYAVRPAPAPGMNTRVMFASPALQSGEHRALFVDPATLDIRGDLVVYGTSGNLPFRTWIDYLHRHLLLGEFGRNYSELAASWLWLAALGGLWLWFIGRRRTSAAQAERSPRLRARRLHGLVGIWVAVGLLFLSATGLTWSKWAGGRIGELRQTMGWVTPSISTQLGATAVAAAPADEHAEHNGGAHAGHATGSAQSGQTGRAGHAGHAGMANTGDGMSAATGAAAAPAPSARPSALFDPILQATRAAGIDSNEIEIRTPRAAGQAWSVRETDRSWPTQVDSIAIDPATMTITSRADFATFPLIAKLIRWGIDMHMGILFGWVNQLLMAAFGIALCVIVALGYAMWIKRRPAPGAPVHTVAAAWLGLSAPARVLAIVAAVALGWSLPLMGLSLLAFLCVDIIRWAMHRRRGQSAAVP